MRRLFYDGSEGCRTAVQQIAANPTRSCLTALGVAVGVVAVTLMGAAIGGIDADFDRTMALLGDDVLYLEQGPWEPGDDVRAYRNRPDIKLAYVDRLNAVIQSNPRSLLRFAVPAPATVQTCVYGERQLDRVYTLGTTCDYGLIATTRCGKGRFLNEAEGREGRNVCVVGFDVAENLFGAEDPLGKALKIGDGAYRVIGVFERQGSFLGLFSFDAQVVIPLTAYLRHFSSNGENAAICVKVKDRREMSAARGELRGAVRRIRGQLPEEPDNFSINEQQAYRLALAPVRTGLAIAGLFITGLALFVGAIGIMNITFVTVKERTREIGARRALGARRRTVLVQFLAEATAISLLGAGFGSGLAFVLCRASTCFLPSLPLRFSPALVLAGFGLSALTGVVSGLVPAWQASRLDPVEALRCE